MTFLRGFGVNAAAGLLTVGLGFANQALLARSLGPHGRGVLALVATSVALGGMLLGEWLFRGNAYHSGRDPATTGPLWANTIRYCAVLLLAGPLLAALAGGGLGLSAGASLTTTQLVLTTALVALFVAQRGFAGILLGSDRLDAFAVVPLLFIACYLGLNAVGQVILHGGLTAVLAAWLAAVAVAAITAALLGRRRGQTDRRLLRAAAVVGGRGALSSTLIFLLFRSDVYLVEHFLGARQLGVYAIAVVLAELLQQGPNIAGTVLLPRVLRGADDDHATSLAVSRWVLGLGLVAAAGVVLVGEPLIGWVFGADYAGAHEPLVWMLPGLVAAAFGSVLNTKLAGSGYPPVTIWAPGVALVINVSMNLILIPRLGLVGAALSTSAAYLVWAVTVAVAFGRATKTAPWRLEGGAP